MTVQTLQAAPYRPTSSLTGNSDSSIFRGVNMCLRGVAPNFYFECYAGSRNLNETIPTAAITGTLTFAANARSVTGTGTSFLTELRTGQMLLCGDCVLVVQEVISDTVFTIDRPATSAQTAQPALRMPVLFEIRGRRGTKIWGNTIEFDKGNLLDAGQGTLRINGAVLPGTSLVSTRRPQLAIYDAATGNYSIVPIGFPAVPAIADIVISVVTGGIKKTTNGYYSFRVAYADSQTAYGFSNPSEVIKVNGAGVALQITAAGQQFEVDLTNAVASKPANCDSFLIYRSAFTGTTQNPVNYAEGSWYLAKTVKIADLVSGKTNVDVLDGEIFTEVTYDNDAPPECEWISVLGGDPVYISCYGKKAVGNDDGTSPGAFVSISKRANRDGAPVEIATPLSPPETIIGFIQTVGRLFLMTPKSLPFATSTGIPQAPIITRPFWETGFKNPFSLVFVNDLLFGFTSKGVTRSIATGDSADDQHALSAAVEEITKTWYGGYVHAQHDPVNDYICFFYSAAYKNTNGYWVTLVLPFSLRANDWMPLIEISRSNRDMIVCGTAKVNGYLEFLAGGRVSGGAAAVDTFRFDEVEDNPGSRETINYYLAYQLTDNGAEDMSKKLRNLRVTGKLGSAKLQIHGCGAGGQITTSDIEAGINPLAEFPLADSTVKTRYEQLKVRVRNLALWSVRVSGSWNGAGMKDRIDEIMIDGETHGRER